MKLKHLKKGSHIHFIGICGVAMGSLASLLKKQGFLITGSDQNIYPPMSEELKRLKIPVLEGFRSENLNPPPDFVIVGNVAQEKFAEVQTLLHSKIPYTSLPKALKELFLNTNHSVVVTGTHGKTSITSMVVWVAKNCGIKPGFFIGGGPQNFSASFSEPEDPWFIIEGDEYDTAFFDKVPKFTHYKPRSLIVSGIEFDHADIYPSIEEVKLAFESLFQAIPKEGLIVANAEDERVMTLLSKSPCKSVFTYGAKEGDYQIQDRSWKGEKHQLTFTRFKKPILNLSLQHYGLYNALNALSVFAMTYELGWPKAQIKKALESFRGVKSRQECLLKEGDVLRKSKGEEQAFLSPLTIIKDFAHHPSSVRVTLEGIRERFLNKRILALFEPRSFSSCQKIFHEKYIESFQSSDLAVIASPYRKNLSGKELLSHNELSRAIQKTGVSSVAKNNVEEILDFLKNEAKKEDVIVIMSNGDFQNLSERLCLLLKKNPETFLNLDFSLKKFA